jgi:membrane-associated phospholipid phosphatase
MPSSRLLRHPSQRSWFLGWLAAFPLALLLTLLVELEALPDEAGLLREVQASGVPGQAVSDAVRFVTGTWFAIGAGAVLVAVHLAGRGWVPALVLGVLLVLMPLTQAGIKELVDRPRPSQVAAGIDVRGSQTSPSYPAGHVMSPTVVYGWAIVMLLRSRSIHTSASRNALDRIPVVARGSLAAVLVAVLAVTGIVNLYLGVHWPTDVLGGYLWGLSLLLPALVVYEAGSGRGRM